jgi:chromosomal replication initiation ATPase DnaA
VIEPSPSDSDVIALAWERVHSAASPELRGWLAVTRPLSLDQDWLMVATPNTFTRRQLEGRFREHIEAQLSEYFDRPVQLLVKVDESLTPPVEHGDPQGNGFSEADSPPYAESEMNSHALPDHGIVQDFGRPPEDRPAAVPPGAGQPAESEVHLRFLRHRRLQPVRPCRRDRGRRESGKVV